MLRSSTRLLPIHARARKFITTDISAEEGLNIPGFSLFPNFFDSSAQRILLTAALEKLDSMETISFRRRRRAFKSSIESENEDSPIQNLFFPDEYYRFEEGHYDGVIHYFREAHVTSWPNAETTELSSILDRLKSLYPSHDTQTHILHLASHGEILPHVDNLGASGTWIMGISLGGERILRMEHSESSDAFDVLLPSGSVYLQRDSIRFDYKHSILRGGTFRNRKIPSSQRLSIMVRDRLPVVPHEQATQHLH